MKKIRILFLCLLSVFIGCWTLKAKTPTDRPRAAEAKEEEGAEWWKTTGTIKADDQYILDPEIPENYIPVPGKEEVYMVVDEKGNITKYRERTRQKDGSWLWKDVNPDIPDNYEPVKGIKNLYKVTNEDGSVSYMKYIRNNDDTYAFVECDKNGTPLEDKKEKGDQIPENYVHVTGNIYAVYNKHGVIIGYKERKVKKDGSYYWVNCKKPKETKENDQNVVDGTAGKKKKKSSSGSTYQEPSNKGSSPSVSKAPSKTEKTKNKDGGYTQKESYTETKVEGNYRITYQTTVTKKYDAKGNLISTKKNGPYQTGKMRILEGSSSAPDRSVCKNTLSEEASRVKARVSFQTSMETKLLSALNAERRSEGLNVLHKNSKAYQIAQCRAADMAVYDYVDYDSYLYGSLSSMLKKYGVSSDNPGENIWKTVHKDVDDIHARFQAVSGSRKTRMSASRSQAGIAIVKKNGYYYVCEIFL